VLMERPLPRITKWNPPFGFVCEPLSIANHHDQHAPHAPE
jgi:hypothetical protein